ncbi:hypothetical protein RHOSPDRAFT_14374 [Rhodotorula sp. JG-1b]|nr:hypothetical protein RHOSPDRAFT_14374 [Rhodotorula sp. JG-1b]
MVTARLRSAARAWPCLSASPAYSTSRAAAPPFSPSLPSTSAQTLDHEHSEPPAWDQLVPTTLTRSTSGAKASKKRGEWIRPQSSTLDKGNWGRQQGLLSLKGKATATAAARGKPPPVDRANISPFLPLVTRERNFLLANLRHALHSRRPPRSARRDRRASLYHGGRTEAAWDPDRVWNALARVLRYPDDVPTLPHSQLPSSTRSPAVLHSPFPSSAVADRGFFTSAHNADEVANEHAEYENQDYVGRDKIDLSLPELRRAFTVFASATPRTRNGLNRLLVVAELIAKHPIHATRRRRLPGLYGAEDGGNHHHQQQQLLHGGGVGLREKDWAALVLSVGANLRTARADPEVKSTLALFSQRLELDSASTTTTPGNSSSRASPAPQRDGPRKLYNALLFVVGRAKMWELFEQVLRRMTEAGIRPDATTLVEMIKREEERGAPISSAWSLFERGVASDDVTHEGKRALWTAILWALAKRSMLEEAMEIYRAMKSGDEVDVATLRPADEHAAALDSPPALSATPPPPDDRVVTSLIQACAYRGDLAGAVRILLHDILAAHAASSSSSSSLRPAVHHFTPIFRAFARYGSSSRRANSTRELFAAAASSSSLDRTTLGGAHLGSHAQKRDALAFAALSSRGGGSSRPHRAARTAAGDPNANPFTLDALWTLWDSFLALQPPPTEALADLPFLGTRTAPSPRDLFWILFAFDRLSGGDPHTVLEVWAAMERKFGGGRGGRSAAGWTGLRVDKRVAKLVATHRATLAERQRRLEELQ